MSSSGKTFAKDVAPCDEVAKSCEWDAALGFSDDGGAGDGGAGDGGAGDGGAGDGGAGDGGATGDGGLSDGDSGSADGDGGSADDDGGVSDGDGGSADDGSWDTGVINGDEHVLTDSDEASLDGDDEIDGVSGNYKGGCGCASATASPPDALLSLFLSLGALVRRRRGELDLRS